jgi:DNA-directed RNA polymerase subunit RPC12/RpoP
MIVTCAGCSARLEIEGNGAAICPNCNYIMQVGPRPIVRILSLPKPTMYEGKLT